MIQAIYLYGSDVLRRVAEPVDFLLGWLQNAGALSHV